MSPEQCLGEEIDSRSDIYSLGIVMYEMLAGVVPFNSPTSTAVVVQHVNKEPPSLRSMNLSISPAVEAVVLHALAKKREERPQSADALAREFSSAVSPAAHQSSFSVPSFDRAPSASPGPQHGLTPTMVMRTPMSGGTPVYLSPAQGVAPAVSSPHQAVARGAKPITIVAGVAASVLIAISIAVYFIFFSFSAKRAILDEVSKGNLVKPEGSSGYDLYMKHKGKDLSANDKEEIARNAQSKLEQRGDEIFTNLKQDQTESEGEWAEANRIYAWLNELRPSPVFESKIHFSQGSSAFARKDYNGAISGYQRASQLQPNWALVLNRLGRCYLNLKDKGSAREYYRQATVAEPAWISPWINLGAVCLDLNDPHSAEPALRQAIEIDAQKASAHNLLGQALEKQTRTCEALEEYSTALNLATNNPTNTVNSDALRRKVTAMNSQLFCGD
jgi:tetratricopeptide (TPR) repeat protein